MPIALYEGVAARVTSIHIAEGVWQANVDIANNTNIPICFEESGVLAWLLHFRTSINGRDISLLSDASESHLFFGGSPYFTRQFMIHPHGTHSIYLSLPGSVSRQALAGTLHDGKISATISHHLEVEVCASKKTYEIPCHWADDVDFSFE